jgi:hypothetical protein
MKSVVMVSPIEFDLPALAKSLSAQGYPVTPSDGGLMYGSATGYCLLVVDSFAKAEHSESELKKLGLSIQPNFFYSVMINSFKEAEELILAIPYDDVVLESIWGVHLPLAEAKNRIRNKLPWYDLRP